MRTKPRRRLHRLAGVLAVILCITLAPAIRANAAIAHDPDELRSRLFAGYMRVKAPGIQGLKDLVLSVAAHDWRLANPNASQQDIVRYMTTVRAAIEAKYQAEVFGTDAYSALVKFVDAASGIPGVSIATPGLKVLLDSTIGTNLAQTTAIENQVTGAFQTNMYLTEYYNKQNFAWGSLARRGEIDPDFTAAWNGMVGGRAGIVLDVTLAQLTEDPVIGTYINVDAILDFQYTQNDYLREIRRQVEHALATLSAKNDEIVAQLAAASLRYPVGPGPKPTPQDYTRELAAAAERQVALDALGSGLFVLSTLAGFADPRLGQHISTLGKAGLAIATSINNYLPTVAGLSVGQALSSLSTMTLTGNILGAVMSVLPMFTGTAGPEQLIMQQLEELKKDVQELREEMHARFDAIERALSIVYVDLMAQFDKLFQEFAVVKAELSDIHQALLRVDSKVDTLALFTARSMQNAALEPVRTNINGYLNYELRTQGLTLDWDRYEHAENSFHYGATNRSRNEPLAATEINNTTATDPAHVLNKYGPSGSVSYLTWLGQHRYQSKVPMPVETVPAAGTFQLSARAYVALQLQNSSHARQMASLRSEQVQKAGRDYLTATRALSAPVDGTTNPVFTGLVAEYRQEVNRVVEELIAVRNRVTGGRYSPFGSPDQAPTTRISGPDALPSCSGPTILMLSTPSNATYSALPNVYQTAALALPDDGKPVFSSCWSASWADVDGDPGENTWGSVQMQFKQRVQYPGGAVQDIRTVTYKHYIGTICSYNPRTETQTCKIPRDEVKKAWATLRPLVEQKGSEFINPPVFDDTHARTSAALHGKARAYYDTANAEIRGDTELGRRNRRLTQTLSLIQAYTEVAFPKALEGNATLNSLLYGNQRLPGDYAPLPGMPGDSGLTAAYSQAAKNYENCKQSGPGRPCEGTFVPNVKNGQYTPYDADCQVRADDPLGDHVGNCLSGHGASRADLLAAQYRRHSQELAAKTYVEGSPQVEALLAELAAADRILHKGNALSQGMPVTSSSTEVAGLDPRYAVDGDTTTRWSSAYTDQEWLQVDLGQLRTINRVVLNWEVAYGRAFQIQTSTDGTTWTTIHTTTAGTGGVQSLTVSGSGRYVRFAGTQRGTQFGYSLWEFQVYGA